MALLKCCYKNILETSSVAISVGSSDESFPLWRLYDRSIGSLFKPLNSESLTIRIDQGASPLAADRLIIPSGHNLAGMTLDIKHSDDDVTYTEAVAQWTGASGDIDKSWNSVTKRFWQFIITDPVSIPEIAELFITQTYTWERNPSRPTGDLDAVFNAEVLSTAQGTERFITYGSPKRQRPYVMPRCGDTQKTNILALNDHCAMTKPFWLYDHDGTLIYGRLRKPLALREIASGSFTFEFDFIEVLP